MKLDLAPKYNIQSQLAAAGSRHVSLCRGRKRCLSPEQFSSVQFSSVQFSVLTSCRLAKENEWFKQY
jgi:hypothetical protein